MKFRQNWSNKEIEAFNFAKKHHEGQFDDSGVEYINHPEQVAKILRQVTDDQDIICAALLHDVIEDTKGTYSDIEEAFGKRVADLVQEVTHQGQKDHHGYYFPDLKSKEGILIKFADRLSNLSRMKPWDEKKQQHYLGKSKFWKSDPSG